MMTVHAHPDDEASKGPSTVAKYKSEGISSVLVCCTGGELGDIANEAMRREEVSADLGAWRKGELDRATKIIGYDEVVQLGYRDSGMAASAGNYDLRCFHQATLDEATGRLVAIIRRTQPQVIVTYGDEQQGYPHPDHIKVHEISVAAFARAGDPTAYPWAGPAWQPLKLYYSMWSRARFIETHEAFVRLGLESPYQQSWFERPWQDSRISTRISVHGYYDVRMNALLAHETQIDPNSPFWFGLPVEVAREIHPFDDYILARSHVEGFPGEDVRGVPSPDAATEPFEADLFAGLR